MVELLDLCIIWLRLSPIFKRSLRKFLNFNISPFSSLNLIRSFILSFYFKIIFRPNFYRPLKYIWFEICWHRHPFFDFVLWLELVIGQEFGLRILSIFRLFIILIVGTLLIFKVLLLGLGLLFLSLKLEFIIRNRRDSSQYNSF